MEVVEWRKYKDGSMDKELKQKGSKISEEPGREEEESSPGAIVVFEMPKEWVLDSLTKLVDVTQYELAFAISYEDGVPVVVPDRTSTSPEELALGVSSQACPECYRGLRF